MLALLSLIATLPLGNVHGRIDHLAYDPSTSRVFIAALGNGSVEVADLNAGRVVHSIAGLKQPQGVFYWPEGNRLWVASAGDGKVSVFDAATYAPVAGYDLRDDADNLRFDPAHKELWVGYGAGALAVINVSLGTQVGEIVLDAHPEAFALEQNGPRLFVNIPAQKNAHVSVIDRRTRSVTAKWPLADVEENFPMALDEAHHRLYVACRRPARLLTLDTQSGKQTASLEIAGDADDLFYDPAHNRLYLIAGEGKLQIVEDQAIRDTLETARGARTGLFLPGRNQLVIAVPARGKQPAELRIYSSR